MNSKKTLGLLSLIAVAFSTLFMMGTSAFMQSSHEYAVIDTERILSDSQLGKRIFAEIESLRNQMQSDITQLQSEATTTRNQLNEGALSLSEQELEELRKKFESQSVALKRATDDATRNLQKLRDEKLKEIEQRVMPVIHTYARDAGYTMVFRKYESGLVYIDESIEITDQVIAHLDSQ